MNEELRDIKTLENGYTKYGKLVVLTSNPKLDGETYLGYWLKDIVAIYPEEKDELHYRQENSLWITDEWEGVVYRKNKKEKPVKLTKPQHKIPFWANNWRKK